MAEPLTITLKTLTPLWTGGADGKSDRLHATGIIGSLRWWYEAVVRGFGGNACDPVEQPCLYDPNQSHNGLCLACQLFGATGWARRFRLVVRDQTTSGGPSGAQKPTGNRYKRDGRTRPSWYFDGGREGTLQFKIIPTSTDFDPVIIQGTLSLIERYGSLAAKPQLGYGWIKITSPPPFDVATFVDEMSARAATQRAAGSELPALDNMFFAQLQVPASGLTPTLNLKYDLRAAFRSGFDNPRLRHWVCGYVRGNERQASKISISQAVGGLVRIWGWIPHDPAFQGITRDQIIAQVKTILEAYGTLQNWREFNSDRDSTSVQTEIGNYLISLLEVRI